MLSGIDLILIKLQPTATQGIFPQCTCHLRPNIWFLKPKGQLTRRTDNFLSLLILLDERSVLSNTRMTSSHVTSELQLSGVLKTISLRQPQQTQTSCFSSR